MLDAGMTKILKMGGEIGEIIGARVAAALDQFNRPRVTASGKGTYSMPLISVTASAGIKVHPSPAATMYFRVSRLVAWRFEASISEHAAIACSRRQWPSSSNRGSVG